MAPALSIIFWVIILGFALPILFGALFGDRHRD
jgi:hypothetical protein